MLKVVVAWPKKYVSGKLLGFCDVGLSLDGGTERYHMIWTGLKIFQGKDGIQVGLPSKKDEKGNKDDNGNVKWHDVIKLPNSEEKPNLEGLAFMADLNQVVAAAYNDLGKEDSRGSGAVPQDKDNVTGGDLPF